MKKLHARWREQVAFLDVLVRQAHPGPDAPPYRTPDQRLRDAAAYRQEEGVPWPVVVDDVAGTVHQVYGGLASPAYLIDRDGRVAFYALWAHGPTLHRAIAALVDGAGRGVVLGGRSRLPHMGATVTDGWRGLRRGLPQSVTDLMIAAPGAPVAIWLGRWLRPALAPLTLRDRPLPAAARIGLGAALLAGLAIFARRRL